MKSLSKLAFAILALLLLIPAYASAKPAAPREHPAYLHALSDLREARAHLLDKPCRAEIALANGRLYARDPKRLGCWNLKK